MTYTKNQLLQSLSKGKHKVRFTNRRGEESTLTVTLEPRLLPDFAREELEESNDTHVPGLVIAFSLDRNEWRSFYDSRVLSVEEV